MQYFCPACFAAISAGTRECPVCGARVAEYGREMDYFDLLVHALGHPIDETRMGAIIALGGRAPPTGRAGRPLMRHPLNVR